MHLSIYNLTDDDISFENLNRHLEDAILPPCSSFAVRVPCNKLHLCHSSNSPGSHEVVRTKHLVELDKWKMKAGVSWNFLETKPWRIYRVRAEGKCQKLLIFPKRNMESFLSHMPDNLRLSSLTLPGTHDTLAFYGWPISQCQSQNTPLSVQLNSGIRVLDVRLAVVDSKLIAYHGSYPQKTPYQHVLSDIHSFLTSPLSCRETIVISIKQEDYQRTPVKVFSSLVHDEIFNGPGGSDMWFFENRIPSLGEVRGKVVLLSRFGGDGNEWENGLEGLGIHPTAWPDSEKFGFSWQCKDTLVRTHDWYAIPSFLAIPEKVERATRILVEAEPPNNPPFPVLSISYTSAASFPLAMPPTVAKGFGWPQVGFGVEGVNSRVARWLLDAFSRDDTDGQLGKASSGEAEKFSKTLSTLEPKIRGWVFMDFYQEPVESGIHLLVECNYRGRR